MLQVGCLGIEWGRLMEYASKINIFFELFIQFERDITLSLSQFTNNTS